METIDIIIAIIGGFFAGILNTMAGYGSIITLAIYMDIFGLAGNIANTTNRVNVFFNSNIAAYTFYKNKKLNLSGGKWILIFTLIGVLLGAIVASIISGDQFKSVFNYLLIPILIILLTNPKKFLHKQSDTKPVSLKLLAPLFIAVGFYAGFIQVGFGILFLMVVVLLGKKNLVHGNAIKITIVAIYSYLVIAIFWFQGLISWMPAMIISIGQAAGGFVAANYLAKHKAANTWAYRLIIVIIIFVLIKNFELYKIFM